MALPSQAERRTSARRIVALDCTLSRTRGNAIAGRTVDLCDDGMRVATNRPLTIDEVLAFDLILEDGELHGRARVLRQTSHDTYALRFEQAA